MPAKKGSKPIYVAGAVHAAFRKKLEEEEWTWGMTKKVETLLWDYVNRGEVTQAGFDPSAGASVVTGVRGSWKSLDSPGAKSNKGNKYHKGGNK